MSKLYLRSSTSNVGSHARTELSTTLPVGLSHDSGQVARDLDIGKGSAVVEVLNSLNPDSTAEQSMFCGKWLSSPLSASAIDANTWTVGFTGRQSWAFTSAFLRVSVYVLTSADAVRGFIYDATADLGIEFDGGTIGVGQVVTFSGSSVAGVVSTDCLAMEAWVVATPSMAGGPNTYIRWDGTVDPIDTVVEVDCASYISTPQDLFPVPIVPNSALVIQPPRIF
jgi:hypothetical protein